MFFVENTLIVINYLPPREGYLSVDENKVNSVLNLCLQCVDKNNIGHFGGFVHKVHGVAWSIKIGLFRRVL